MPFDADALIEKFVETEETFRIPTSDDPAEDLICKTVAEVSAMSQINIRAAEIIKMWANPPPAWKAYGPVTKEVATIVAEIELLIVEPKFNTLQALKLCKQAGVFAAFVHSQIMQRIQQDLPTREMEAVEEEKNGSRPITSASSNGFTSPSDTSTSENTLTTLQPTIGDTPAST